VDGEDFPDQQPREAVMIPLPLIKGAVFLSYRGLTSALLLREECSAGKASVLYAKVNFS
jgi:hypothetical protein